jgi:hypothetical protein
VVAALIEEGDELEGDREALHLGIEVELQIFNEKIRGYSVNVMVRRGSLLVP